MQNKTILLIDANALCYRSMFTMQGLSYKEMETGIIYGFLNQIIALTKKFKTQDLCFAWDSRKSVRKRIYPQYKENRAGLSPDTKILKEISFPQFDLLRREIIPQIGWKNNWLFPGYESDDILALLVKRFKETQFTIVSSDHDFYQLLDRCDIYDPAKKKIKNKAFLFEEYAIMRSKQYAYALAIAGCTTDNVKGISGVGMATALKYIVNQGGGMKERLYKKIVSKEGQQIIRRNLQLVTLPFPGWNPGIIDLQFGKGSLSGFQDVCQRFNLLSFINTDRFLDWKKILN
jgi:5'-3' exonuclease